jgi:hypothetical protein
MLRIVSAAAPEGASRARENRERAAAEIEG